MPVPKLLDKFLSLDLIRAIALEKPHSAQKSYCLAPLDILFSYFELEPYQMSFPGEM